MTRQERAAAAFIAPVGAAIGLVFVVPTLAAVLLSFTDFDIYALGSLRDLRVTGLANYVALASAPLFWRALGNTLLLAVVGVPATLGASLAAALLLDSAAVRAKALWRAAFFAPYVTTLVAVAVVWRYVLNTRFGLLNRGLEALHLPAVDWLGDPHLSIPAILVFVTWKVFGYNMIVFTAALSAVSDELMEAARLDGAGLLARIRHVVLPAIAPVVLLAGLLSIAGFLQIFDEPYVMTQGGPAQSTTTLLYFMFDEGFTWWSLGSAAAVSVVLFLLTWMVTRAQVALGRRRGWA